jgi:hypothetical protein
LQIWLDDAYYGFKQYRMGLLKAFRSVPVTVERLAVRMSYIWNENLAEWTDEDAPENDLVVALKHLSNLKHLVLPFHCILSRSDGKLEKRYRVDLAEKRATRLACKFTCPKLENVFYQGAYGKYDNGGNPVKDCNFNESDDVGRRFVVRLIRGPVGVTLRSNDGGRAMRRASRYRWGQYWMDTSTSVVVHGMQVRAQVISACCLCKLCWTRDNLSSTIKNRLCGDAIY